MNMLNKIKISQWLKKEQDIITAFVNYFKTMKMKISTINFAMITTMIHNIIHSFL